MILKPHHAIISYLKNSQKTLLLLCFAVFTFVTFKENAYCEGNNRNKQFSNLSDGFFERQLPVPESTNLDTTDPMLAKALQTYDNLPFGVGERLRYFVTYLGVKGGSVEVMVRSPLRWQGGWAHRLTGEVRSADWFRWVYDMHDTVESVLDPAQELAPLRFYINQLENAFKQSKVLDFDGKNHKIYQVTQRKDRARKNDEFDFADGAKDALGAMYYFRSKYPLNSEVKEVKFPIFTSEKTWTCTVNHLRSEKITVEGRTFDTDVYSFLTQFGGLLEQKGKLMAWITRDERRIAVYIEAELKVGSVKMHLAEYDQGLADPHKKKVFPAFKGN